MATTALPTLLSTPWTSKPPARALAAGPVGVARAAAGTEATRVVSWSVAFTVPKATPPATTAPTRPPTTPARRVDRRLAGAERTVDPASARGVVASAPKVG